MAYHSGGITDFLIDVGKAIAQEADKQNTQAKEKQAAAEAAKKQAADAKSDKPAADKPQAAATSVSKPKRSAGGGVPPWVFVVVALLLLKGR